MPKVYFLLKQPTPESRHSGDVNTKIVLCSMLYNQVQEQAWFSL